MSYAMVDDVEARRMKPRVVHVDESNRIITLAADPAEPVPGAKKQKRIFAA